MKKFGKWKKTISMICTGGLTVICLAGCGKGITDSPVTSTHEVQQNNVTDVVQMNNESDRPSENDTLPEYGADHDETLAEQEVDNNTAAGEASGSMDGGKFYDGANLEGSVVEFTEEGFSLSPATSEKIEGGGEILSQAAPGAESDENIIRITYTDNTVFQIVNLSMSSQSEISREDTDKESVKKQSSVCVFGTCQDTYHWTADKILILRWQE